MLMSWMYREWRSVSCGGGTRRCPAAVRRRLVCMLSDRRDWAGLLRLAMSLPIRDAVVSRRRFSPRWRP